ncbi:hypothetical protein CCHOA_10765 [Corynebacterium choanae]|uniref:Uncharacterized protein n=1 Tax=Corynebacterium choanae TaxID=1862358 RepID=A0A3G6J9S3_9CORY|nr:hypothetical protein CCHOA_10765 [Corynebacterium choanae]
MRVGISNGGGVFAGQRGCKVVQFALTHTVAGVLGCVDQFPSSAGGYRVCTVPALRWVAAIPQQTPHGLDGWRGVPSSSPWGVGYRAGLLPAVVYALLVGVCCQLFGATWLR